MHDLLKPYVTDGLSYIDRDELVSLLIKTDLYYWCDDLNYLTLTGDCLCGFLPGTDVSRNFCYLRMFDREMFGSACVTENHRVENYLIISCRDLEPLERFLDFYSNHRLFKKFSINIPSKFSSDDGEALETVKNLIEKYNGYYRLCPDSPSIHDYRFPDSNNVPAPTLNPIYRVEQIFCEDDPLAIRDLFWVLHKLDSPLCNFYLNPYCADLGLKCVAFHKGVDPCGDKTVTTDDVLYFWQNLAEKYTKKGYIVKSVATNEGFDRESIYETMGMTRYRSFITLVTEDFIT